jgi:hypothetical protein
MTGTNRSHLRSMIAATITARQSCEYGIFFLIKESQIKTQVTK